MKNIYTGFCILLLFIITSCKKDVLEKAPGVDVTENTIFSTRENVEGLLSTIYQISLPSILPNRDATILSSPTGSSVTLIGTLAAATDEGENESGFQFCQSWNSAAITSAGILSQEDNKYHARWKGIRYANILLERVDEVPGLPPDYIKQLKAEAKFLRALNNFETLKRYGGFPIINKRFTSSDEAKVARSTFEECVNFIVKDCDDAIPDLQTIYTASQRGRATKMAAMALISRTLLYAASPLFNTATPYISMANPADNKLICYGNYDKNRWDAAAKAAKRVIDSATSSLAGVSLITSGVKDPITSSLATGNYRISWEKQDNAEIILADKSYAASSKFGFPWQHILPIPMGGFYGGTTVTHNFVTKYERKTDGLPQTWSASGGDDLVQKYNELDPRFKQSVGYNQSRWSADFPIIETFTGGAHATNCFGGAWMSKHVPEALTNAGGSVPPSIPIFKLNEFYLNYAEALNEFVGPTAEAYSQINTIRSRSGMPNLPANLDINQFRARVQNERAIELAFEDHRFWDIRRWMIAEQDGVMKGAIYGIKITKLTPTTFRYMPYIIENRSFNKNMYLHPFDQNEILKGNLKQNPGW